ncbi:MAG: hypothetical protein G01um101430_623 [Parcubacteria group bacterium Gr01-1014_30]|nr:MAG: hypothetical protein G01um101430_623 [Parcubacteria group bacterium Gr01-1014_30]
MLFDYQKICAGLLSELPSRQKETLIRRFGLAPTLKFGVGVGQGAEPETLESIGRSFGITRERVRQIEKDGIGKIRLKLGKHEKVFQYFKELLDTTGGLRKEDVLLSELGGQKCSRHTFFLLTLEEPFHRFPETEEFHSLWTLSPKVFETAKNVVNSFRQKLARAKKLLNLSDFGASSGASSRFLEYYLEISKTVQRNQEGLFGLSDWPEINPRSIKDKSFLALRKAGKPLHFRDVAQNIGPDALPQTVHNELIRDPRFVLVGRGLYALREWGFKDGQVKDIIHDLLAQSSVPMSRQEILEKVLQQRLVKESTVLLNLNNKKYFVKDSQEKYQIKEA